ncbi:hypothetical protein JIN85_19050 [Luteolibacter pohnpeiensis]|uniref:Uncharacterized protein n=1 Tax=Luteolibacter pohnpeiensis TaxID=454153 RepID=A0A934S9B6_9BACT|nr:hypothetical protein [Luteolibacter pohnpeiensis]
MMSIVPRRAIHCVIGALLPVPLFVGIFYCSYFYKSCNGFDFEAGTYITDSYSIEMSRRHVGTDVLVFLAMGYFLMGVPSLVASGDSALH